MWWIIWWCQLLNHTIIIMFDENMLYFVEDLMLSNKENIVINFKHEYLRSRAYICLSLSSPLSSHRYSNFTTIEILVLLSWITASKEFSSTKYLMLEKMQKTTVHWYSVKWKAFSSYFIKFLTKAPSTLKVTLLRVCIDFTSFPIFNW